MNDVIAILYVIKTANIQNIRSKMEDGGTKQQRQPTIAPRRPSSCLLFDCTTIAFPKSLLFVSLTRQQDKMRSWSLRVCVACVLVSTLYSAHAFSSRTPRSRARDKLPTLESADPIKPPKGFSLSQFYLPTYTLLRAGPVSFARRLGDSKGYEQKVMKYMIDFNEVSLGTAQGNADAYLTNPGACDRELLRACTGSKRWWAANNHFYSLFLHASSLNLCSGRRLGGTEIVGRERTARSVRLWTDLVFGTCHIDVNLELLSRGLDWSSRVAACPWKRRPLLEVNMRE
jgi:hypothetical protein